MAKLTAKRRNALPASKFALKQGGKEKYPVDTKGRAVAAKGRATQAVAKGRLTPEQASKIKHKADAVLGKHDCAYHNTGKC
jgi:hypothetical protein